MNELLTYIKSDLYRRNGSSGFRAFLKLFYSNIEFKFTCYYRISYLLSKKRLMFCSFVARRRYYKLSRKVGIRIEDNVKFGFGLLIIHGSGTVIESNTVFGDNLLITHNNSFISENGKAPTIGSKVRFAPGSVVVGDVNIGHNCVIGANCVITKDVPSNNVAVGIPNKNLNRSFQDFTDRYYWEGT